MRELLTVMFLWCSQYQPTPGERLVTVLSSCSSFHLSKVTSTGETFVRTL